MNITELIKNEINRYFDNYNINDEYNSNSDSNILCEDTPTLSYNDGKSICYKKHKDPNKQYFNKIIYLDDKYNKDEEYINKIKSYDYTFHHIPNIKAKRDCLYICAPNQSGKSTYVSNYLEYFKKIYNEKNKNMKPIYLFSKLKEDPILDKYDPIRININKFRLDNETLEKMANSIAIFDDVDQIHDKKIRTKIYNTIDEILCNGAHFNIHIIITNHLCSDYKNTRVILNECSSITVFCKSGSRHQIRYTLKNYFGLSKDQIDKICKLRSRWVTIFKHYPQCVLYSRGI